MSLITVIGAAIRERAISHTLYASGVYMGNALNRSGDKMPPQKLYDACRVMAQYVEWKGAWSGTLSRCIRWISIRSLSIWLTSI